MTSFNVAVEAEGVCSAFYVREPGDGGVDLRRVPGPGYGRELGKNLCLGRVNAGQVDRVRGLRSPGRRHRPHGHAAQQTSEQDQDHVARPPPVKRGAGPVGRHPESVVGHHHWALASLASQDLSARPAASD